MKNFFKNSILFAVITLIAMFALRPNGVSAASPDPMIFSVNVPADLQSSLVRQDFENESIFSFKNGNASVFLFSVTRVTDSQWIALSHQVKNAMVIKNEDGYIYFVQKTDQSKIKGESNVQYQQVLNQLDALIAGIRFNA